MQVHQVLVSAAPGDAITNAAFEIHGLLSEAVPSQMFARYVHPGLADKVRPLDHYGMFTGSAAVTGDDVIIFHASIGEPAVHSFLLDRPERLVLVYHNISPAEPFVAYDPAYAGLLAGGRRELEALADRCVLALAVSEFNATELRQMGYRNVRVVPLIINTTALLGLEPDEGMAEWLSGFEGPVLLYVGQLMPHKRPDLLAKAFHVLSTYLAPHAQLLMPGAGRLPAYAERFRAFVRELNITNLHLLGAVTGEQLVACFRRADAFVTASEHEGFCVPLVEAMAFDVPVVARRHAAIPETVGDAGLLLPAEDDPLLLAEAAFSLATDPKVHDHFVKRGQKRLSRFEPDLARAAMLRELIGVL